MPRGLITGVVLSGIVVIVSTTNSPLSHSGQPWNVIVNLSEAFLASVVFYLIVVALPRRRDAEHVGEFVGPRTRWLIGSVERTVGRVFEEAGYMDGPHCASVAQFDLVYDQIAPTDRAPISTFGERGIETGDWALFHLNMIDDVREFRRDIIAHLPLLDAEFIRLLNDVEDSGLFGNEFFLRHADRMSNKTLKVLGRGSHDTYQAVQRLRDYCQKHAILRRHVLPEPDEAPATRIPTGA